MSSETPQTHWVESELMDWLERSVRGVFAALEEVVGFVNENGECVGEGGEGNFVMSIMEVLGKGFVAARRAAFIVALGSDGSVMY